MSRSKPLLIGLSGKAGSGKSTVGDYLAGAHGYAQFAFAGALKEVVQTAFHFTDEQMAFKKEAVDPRCGKSPRWCLQHFGSAFQEVWPKVWIYNLCFEILDFQAALGQHHIVVTDVRFRDEAEALKKMGAVLVRIERDKDHSLEACATGIEGHISEMDLDGWEGWDYRIANDGSMADLAADVENMLTALALNP